MARFITRVELHDATYPYDYQILHAEMGKEGFVRKIISVQGGIYNLPTAEYYKEGDFTLEQILNDGKKAAQRTNKIFAIITSEIITSMWDGLEKVSSK